jgi:hypothetical protein
MSIWTRSVEGTLVYVGIAAELISAAATVAMLTAWTAAHLLPGIYLSGASPDDPVALAFVCRSYTIAAFYGLAVGALIGATTTEYLAAALTPAVPAAAGLLIVAAFATSIPPASLAGWLQHLRHPVIPVLLAAAGILAMRYATAGLGSLIPAGPAVMLRLGAALTGAGIALTVTRRPLTRAISTAILALGCAVVASTANTRLITLGLRRCRPVVDDRSRRPHRLRVLPHHPASPAAMAAHRWALTRQRVPPRKRATSTPVDSRGAALAIATRRDAHGATPR